MWAHKHNCEHRTIKCQYCKTSYKPDEEELHRQGCGLYWKEKCNDQRLQGMAIRKCIGCKKRLNLQLLIKLVIVII